MALSKDQFKPVESGMIQAVGYDPISRTLGVQFKNGVVYHYPDVDNQTHNDMMGSESVGKWFNENIKGKIEGVNMGKPEEDE